jgi:phosphoribosylanthranilate isomerase
MSERRTRIKICGLTRGEDVDLAVALGADAVGFVLFPASPRYVTPAQLKQLVARLPPFVTSVGLFVNAPRASISALLGEAPLTLLQFHGEESPADCAGFGIPYLRAIGVKAGLDLVEFAQRHHAAKALLLDAETESYGGAGKTFDWSLIPQGLGHRAVLSGGLNAQNVAEAIARVRPFAVDVASGVERAKGIKDEGRMRAFFDAVRRADTLPEE